MSSRRVRERFPDKLRAVRQLHGLSQAELARRSGFQPSAVSHFEQGRRAPSIQNLERLADVLDVAVDYLLGRTKDPAEGSLLGEQLLRDFEQLDRTDQEVVAQLVKGLAENVRIRPGSK